MIPDIIIREWAKGNPWQTLSMIEHDLIISRALVCMYCHSEIQDNFLFRGGTALNKLYIKPSARYSEDIDLVKVKKGAIGAHIDLIRSSLDDWLGSPIRKFSDRSAKLIYKYTSVEGNVQKLKIEINTIEHLQVEGVKEMEFSMNSPWFSGSAKIPTYYINELMATKLRALYQRRKGRDLFDLWFVLERGIINIERVISILEKYMSYNNQRITKIDFQNNLNEKKQHLDFQNDMSSLLPKNKSWDFNKAFSQVVQEIIEKIPK